MSFDLNGLARAIKAHTKVARVLILRTKGSTPRGAGTAMLVWQDDSQEDVQSGGQDGGLEGGQSGTIGGGALEHLAVTRARDMLESGSPDRLDQLPLGPNLAQCCGGAVTLLTEIWDAARLAPHLASDAPIARPLPGHSAQDSLALHRAQAHLRDGRAPHSPHVADGWVVEATAHPQSHLWIWGAGHVGRALIHTLHPLPDFALTWIDTGPERFPDQIPDTIRALPTPDPARAVQLAPPDAHHLILTYSHQLDLDLCHQLLRHGFASAGLIGSATKWARFQKRLLELRHSPAQISRITCPIGDPSLGKHPQAIAVGVVSALLSSRASQAADQPSRTGAAQGKGP